MIGEIPPVTVSYHRDDGMTKPLPLERTGLDLKNDDSGCLQSSHCRLFGIGSVWGLRKGRESKGVTFSSASLLGDFLHFGSSVPMTPKAERGAIFSLMTEWL